MHKPDANCESVPACLGQYDASRCPWECPRETRWECLEIARLAQDREANQHRRRRAGELGPVGRHLRRLGYGPLTCRDADTWRS